MYYFRVDGNADIGMGHIMRCLSIAEEARRHGIQSVFILSDDILHNLVTDRGHQVVVLNTFYNVMGEQDEMEGIQRAIKGNKPTALIVDSYFVTDEYLTKLKYTCNESLTSLVYIDDLVKSGYPCDILIDYNIYGDQYESDYKALYGAHPPYFILGAKFTPLRYEFNGIPNRITRRVGKRILVSTGGSGYADLTKEIIMEAGESEDGYNFDIIVGNLNKDFNEIQSAASQYKNIEIYRDVKNMSELMKSSDVAISAAGSTLYELCATQTPTVTFILADNQKSGAECFDQEGIMEYCGDVRELGTKVLAEKLVSRAIELCENYDKREMISAKQRLVVDGHGANRIIENIRQYSYSYYSFRRRNGLRGLQKYLIMGHEVWFDYSLFEHGIVGAVPDDELLDIHNDEEYKFIYDVFCTKHDYEKIGNVDMGKYSELVRRYQERYC